MSQRKQAAVVTEGSSKKSDKHNIEILIEDILLNVIVKQVVNDEKVTKSDSKPKFTKFIKFTRNQDVKIDVIDDIVETIMTKVVEKLKINDIESNSSHLGTFKDELENLENDIANVAKQTDVEALMESDKCPGTSKKPAGKVISQINSEDVIPPETTPSKSIPGHGYTKQFPDTDQDPQHIQSSQNLIPGGKEHHFCRASPKHRNLLQGPSSKLRTTPGGDGQGRGGLKHQNNNKFTTTPAPPIHPNPQLLAPKYNSKENRIKPGLTPPKNKEFPPEPE